jgi:hypothetical protein
MIGTTTSVAATAGIVALGQWSQDKKIGVPFIVGTGIFAVGLAILGEADAEFAAQVGLLVMITAFLIYASDVSLKLGLRKPKGFLGGLGGSISGIAGVR